MSAFQLWGLAGAALWLAVTGLWFRRSTPVLVGGLVAIGAYAGLGLVLGWTTLPALGLGPAPLAGTILAALLWLLVMLGASPIADRFASALFSKPPTLGAFKTLQQSKVGLVAGIALAWLLGGVLEELALRGLILRAVETGLAPLGLTASLAGIWLSALAAWVLHLYQGPRAALIIAILSQLFGGLFIISGHNLWAVMLCHGLYDTVAFIRFAMGKSKYSRPAG